MQIIDDRHQVSWVLFPHNNDRTAYRPFGLPLILVEPDRRTLNGGGVVDAAVQECRIVIEDATDRFPVAGHDHVGLLFPDTEILTSTLSRRTVADRLIDIASCTFFDTDGNELTYAEATFGDFVQYTTASGIRDTMSYLPTANYYDFSDLTIPTAGLTDGYYTISYRADYYARIVTDPPHQQLVCIDSSKTITSVFRFRINHPGQIMSESVRLTPQPYLDAVADKSEDVTIGFYRPFVDILQDVFDEQELLGKLNWVGSILPEYVPYLGYLTGLDIPFFPGSADRLRRAMLANAVRLQQLKGSRRAVLELFELFGYIIDIVNLYWSVDGKRLIRPGDELPRPYTAQSIEIEEAPQLEPLLVDYATDGFGQLSVPLLFRPDLEIEPLTITGYLVTSGSEIHDQLTAVMDVLNTDPADSNGAAQQLLEQLEGEGLEGYSSVIIDSTGISTLAAVAAGRPPLAEIGTKLLPASNLVQLTFDGAISFSADNTVLFAFASYSRQKLIIPDAIADLHSNRFDVRLRTRSGDPVTADVLSFLVDFIFKLKGFHSLLNVVVYEQTAVEVYQVTDMCVGGDVSTRPDTDLGQLQVPPPIAPHFGDTCDNRQEVIGYKPSDIKMRAEILQALAEEHAAWKKLDDRAGNPQSGATRLDDATEDLSRELCKFAGQGQDVNESGDKTQAATVEFSPTANANRSTERAISNLDEHAAKVAANNDTSLYGSFIKNVTVPTAPICDPGDQDQDYCYRGRVADDLLYQSVVPLVETYRNKNCKISLGGGTYYELPRTIDQGGLGYLSRLLTAARPIDDTWALHFVDGTPTADIADSRNYPAINRQSLGIEIPLLHFPGCRFPSMGRLTEDFEHPTYRARPWDDPYSTYCAADLGCREKPSYLNAALSEDGTSLEFDDAPFTIYGNGRTPDISSLGNHDVQAHFEANDVVRSIYTSVDGGHEAIEVDTMVTSTGDTISTDNPIFSSGMDCGGMLETDFIDGYPADAGYFDLAPEDLDRGGLYADFFEAMGMPEASTGTGVQLLYTLGAGLRIGDGYRLDCGCLTVCGGTEYAAMTCVLPLDQDEVEIEQRMRVLDILGAREFRLDGAISNLFLLN